MFWKLLKVFAYGFTALGICVFGFSINLRPHTHCMNHVHFGTLDICHTKGDKNDDKNARNL